MGLCGTWVQPGDYCSPCDDYALDAGILEDKALIASEILFLLSGQQFSGECTETIRPCSSNVGIGIPFGALPFTPVTNTFDRRIYSGCTCGSWDACGCPPLSQFTFPHAPFPVSSIDEVKVDGVVLTENVDYRLDPPSTLVFLGDRRIPCCQNLRLADTESGTWSISYTYGNPPPAAGVAAAATLACELYLACQPEAFEGMCRLPLNAITIARQGVTVAKFVGELFTPVRGRPVRFGIPEIDLFLAAYNPTGNTSPMVFLSPDEPDIARITG